MNGRHAVVASGVGI